MKVNSIPHIRKETDKLFITNTISIRQAVREFIDEIVRQDGVKTYEDFINPKVRQLAKTIHYFKFK
jgi:hypothetical protein